MKELYRQLELAGWLRVRGKWVRNQPQSDVFVSEMSKIVKVKK